MLLVLWKKAQRSGRYGLLLQETTHTELEEQRRMDVVGSKRHMTTQHLDQIASTGL